MMIAFSFLMLLDDIIIFNVGPNYFFIASPGHRGRHVECGRRFRHFNSTATSFLLQRRAADSDED